MIAMMCFISIGGVVDLISKFEIGFLYRVIIAVIFAVVQFSFSVKPFDFIKLIAQYMTLLAVIFVFLFVLVVMFIDCKEIKGTAELFKNGKFDLLYVIGIIFISFNSHNNIIECFKVFNMRTKKRGNKVILMHFIFIFLFFLTFAGVSSLFILIAHNQLSTTKNIFIYLFVSIISNGIALFTRNILTIVGIAGGVCTCVISFVFPCYAYNKLLIGDTAKQILNYAIIIVAFLLGLMITGYALYDCANVEINI